MADREVQPRTKCSTWGLGDLVSLEELARTVKCQHVSPGSTPPESSLQHFTGETLCLSLHLLPPPLYPCPTLLSPLCVPSPLCLSLGSLLLTRAPLSGPVLTCNRFSQQLNC